MPNKVLMPALSPTMTEGKLAKWVKKEGDTVEAGDVIAEIETDKATMEVEAVDEGTLAKIYIEEGTEGVAVNTVIAVLLEEGESLDDVNVANDKPAAAAPAPKAEEAPKAAPAPVAVQSTPSAKDGNRIFASPLAKRLAKEQNIDLSTIQGSGPRGRIVKADLQGAPKKSASASAPAPAAVGELPYEAVPNTMMRKVIAKRLTESKQTIPHYYLTIDVQLDKLMKLRAEVNAAADGAYKVSVNDFIVKACGLAQERFPAANVSWTDDATFHYKRSDVSVAVATPTGLITPIVKDAANKSLKQISMEIKDLAGRAKEGKLMPEEYQGGTMTLSNLGMFGIDNFKAIINPPQATIIAVGAGRQKPVVINGEIKVATVMSCTASFDHRAIDGAVGAQYLAEFKKLIEETPHALLM